MKFKKITSLSILDFAAIAPDLSAIKKHITRPNSMTVVIRKAHPSEITLVPFYMSKTNNKQYRIDLGQTTVDED